ncbi:hypothetical protein [Lactiplantibacillus plantarum]|uniref:hypothetical protein n=1 Tax=Lactiplantibacillus plantarum TaxID=1590 RepID=UPI00404663FA
MQYDAIGLGRLIAHGEVSPRELADTALQACAQINPKINAVIESWSPDLADVAPARESNSPLAGVPFLIKDVGVAMAGRKLYLGLLAVMMIQADTSANLGKPLEIEFQYQKF